MTSPDPITPPEADLQLTPDEEAVWDVIGPKLNGRTIKSSQLAEIVGLTDRRVRKIIKCLIENHGKPVGSRTGKPAGYWEITDPAERQEVYEAWRRRGISILARAARLKGITLEEELVAVQLELSM